MTEEKANELSSCGYGCYIIGGPWITYNPNCPKHGTEARWAENEMVLRRIVPEGMTVKELMDGKQREKPST